MKGRWNYTKAEGISFAFACSLPPKYPSHFCIYRNFNTLFPEPIDRIKGIPGLTASHRLSPSKFLALLLYWLLFLLEPDFTSHLSVPRVTNKPIIQGLTQLTHYSHGRFLKALFFLIKVVVVGTPQSLPFWTLVTNNSSVWMTPY